MGELVGSGAPARDEFPQRGAMAQLDEEDDDVGDDERQRHQREAVGGVVVS